MQLTHKASQNFRIAYALNIIMKKLRKHALNIVLFALLIFITLNSFVSAILINNYWYFSIFIVIIISLHILIFLFTKRCYSLIYELQISTTDYQSNNIIVPLLFSLYAILLLVYSIYFFYLTFLSDTYSNLNQKISTPIFVLSAIVSNYVNIKFWLYHNIKNKQIKNAI